MQKKKKIIIVISAIALLLIIGIVLSGISNSELKTIRSNDELFDIYNGSRYHDDPIRDILTMPFSLVFHSVGSYGYSYRKGVYNYYVDDGLNVDNSLSESADANGSSSKDYSTTNIQVENVDEADITKTDGDYIYSLSENSVVITNVIDPNNIKIESRIETSTDTPVDLLLYKNKLVVILETANNYGYYYRYNSNTIVNIYDITDKASPKKLKSYEISKSYYTSRCIDNRLFIISSGYLTKKDDSNIIDREYKENGVVKEIPFKNIKYLKDAYSYNETIISGFDLDNLNEDVLVDSYLIDTSNIYVSEDNIYILNDSYNYNTIPIRLIFGLKGLYGIYDYDGYGYDYNTHIYKFNILKNGRIKYAAKGQFLGETINQYSLDESEGHLRVASYNDKGTRIIIFDDNLKEIGSTDYVAKGEKMYSSRFIGDKAYLVTYRTMDPLFVFDLSNETNPIKLGELHIPGYSTYLHPYDENHLIGIGMETKEVTHRDSNGRVISTTASTVGMKMALFDITDVNNPIQVSQTLIGDRRTSSAILTNPKALLFSKEKELIAIPVNNYKDDFEVGTSDDNAVIENLYRNSSEDYVSEGYLVYNINLSEGFTLKGSITHGISDNNKYSYYYNSRLLRGLYIDDNLYTISQEEIKVNKINSLELVSELKLMERND